MLSRSNWKEQLRQHEAKKQRFAIKKLTVGVASVLIGFTFMGIGTAANADSSVADNGSASTATDPAASNKQTVTLSQTAGAANGAATTENKANTNSLNTAAPAPVTANQAAESKAPVQAQEVTDWQGFVNAMNDANVGTITLSGDITVANQGTNVSGINRPNPVTNGGKMNLTGENIARTLTIDGQGHTINFGANYLSFTTANQQKSTPWNLTFKNITINADGYDNSWSTFGGAFSPIYMGGDDIRTELLAKNKVTFENVTADVKNGAFYNTTMAQQITDNPYTTVTFKGNNQITCEAVNVAGNQLYNYSSAVSAAHIIFADGTNTVFNVSTAKTNNDQNAGGNILRANVEDPNDSAPAIDVQQGATVTLNGQSTDVKGMLVNRAITGTVQVDGNLNANMADGHSVAIWAGNLNIGKTGVVNIQTRESNDGTGANGVTNYNGYHFAPISLGVGFAANVSNAGSNLLNNAGKLTIVRTGTNSTSPLISFGSGNGTGGQFTLNVQDGATLDLQDGATSSIKGSFTNTPNIGLVTMWGNGGVNSATFAKVNITNPGYVNFQRTGSQTGTLLRLENMNNHVNISGNGGVLPLAYWDEGNKGGASSYWYIKSLTNQNNWGNNAISGFTAAGQTIGQNQNGEMKFLHSNGTVTFAGSQAGLNSYQYQDGTVTTGQPTPGVDYETPYLNNFLNTFNWWTPQRVAMGTSLATAAQPTDADKYQPEVQTINATTKQHLTDLNVQNGIKDLIDQTGAVVPNGLANIDWNKSHWYDAAQENVVNGTSQTDQAIWQAQYGTGADAQQPVLPATNANGTLKQGQTAATATIVYNDGSVDFVTIPLAVTDQTLASQYAPAGGSITVPEGHQLTPADAANAITNKGQLVDQNGHSVVAGTNGYTWHTAPATDVPGVKNGLVTVTYTDGSTDEVPVTVNVESQADQYTPQGQPVSTSVGTVPPAQAGIANPGDLPAGTSYTWSKAPAVSKAGTVPGVINVTYPDQSVDQVPVKVVVGNPTTPSTTRTDAEQNDPQGQTVTTTIGTLPDAATAVTWPAGQPTGGTPTYTWSQTPDVYSQGQHPGVVQVTYPDGSVDYVPTTVTVTNTPTGKDVTTPKGTLPDASTTVDWGQTPAGQPLSQPSNTTVTWGTEPDVSQPGDSQGTVKITYPNGETTTVVVPVHVTDPDANNGFAPYGTTIRVAYGHDLTDQDAQRAIAGGVPSDATGVTYTWSAKPATSGDGISNTTQQGYVTVKGTLNGQPVSKDVLVYVHVGDQADNYAPQGKNLTVEKGASVPAAATAITNQDTLPQGTKYDWAYTPDTSVVGTQSTLVKVTYPDGSVDYVPVNVTVTETAKDSDQYPVNYGGLEIERPTTASPATKSELPTTTTGMPAGTITGYAKGTFTDPAGVTTAINPTTGEITVTVTKDASRGTFNVPVAVRYQDGTAATVYVPVSVTGLTVDPDGHTTYYGNQTNTDFSADPANVHKTSVDNVPAAANSGFNTITYNYDWDGTSGNGNYRKHTTYKLNAAGTEFVNIADPSDKFAASDISYTWLNGYAPNTNFGDNTATTLANSPLEKTGQGDNLPGNSKYRYNFTVSNANGTATELGLGYGDYQGWCNVFFNFYGAKTGEALTFKQNSDISNLTQDQYRHLIDVTDLGAAGWNGQNANPNAPQVLAYVPGTDTAKTFTMTWAPSGQPSTANVANGVAGTVRIAFNDGTYLDVPATINVVKDEDSGKQDQDKTAFTQKIVYTYNGKEVAYTTIDNIAKGANLTAAQLKNAIDSNVPADYTVVSNYTYPAARDNITATPAEIVVPLALKSSAHFDAQGQIVYQTADGTQVGTGDQIKSKVGDTLTAGLLRDLANQKVPAGYTIARYPGSYNVTADHFVIPVEVELSSTATTTYYFYSQVTVKAPDGTTTTKPRQELRFTYAGLPTDADVNVAFTNVTIPSYAGYTPEVSLTPVSADGTPMATLEKDADGNWGLKLPKPVLAYSQYNYTVSYRKSGEAKQGDVVITYVDQKNPSTVLGTMTVTGQLGSTVDVATTIKDHVPANWTIASDYQVPSTAVVPGAVTVPLVHATKTVNPGDPGVNPTDPLYQGMFKTVTRTIIVNHPDGTTSLTTQPVHFNRSETIDKVTNQVLSYGAWTLATGSAADWGEFNVPQLAGYTSYVDGTAATDVAAEQVTPETADVTVEVTYQAADHHDGGGNDGHTTPTTPDQHNNGNGGNGNPGTPTNDHGNIIGGRQSANNGQHAAQLPQTSDTKNIAAVAGLGLASLTAMLGLGGLKKKND